MANGRRVRLRVDPELRVVRTRTGGGAPGPSGELGHAATTMPSGAEPGISPIPGETFGLRRVEVDEAFAMAPVEAGTGPSVGGALAGGPVYRLGREYRAVATDRVVVGVGDAAELIGAALDRIVGPGGYEIGPERHGRVVVRLLADADPVTVSARLRRRAGIAFAEPDMVTLHNPVPPSPDVPVAEEVAVDGGALVVGDPLSLRQKVLERVRAVQAFDHIKGGRPDVLIAVLDALVDRDHPDLQPAIEGMLDVLGSMGGDLPDGHATACAGLAAAVADNGVGIRGVAAGCRLLPVRFAASRVGAFFRFGGSAVHAAQAVDEAVAAGAWVISLSWVFVESKELADAIERARTNGRGGKGCVVVAGVGNDGVPAHFPARMETVLGVGACTDDDEPKKRTTEQPWSSCFGAGVRVVAPGVRNLTTDVLGVNGLNVMESPEGDFVTFLGTSAATAIVAGAAALVLSANPCLREEQVREILCSTAERVKTVTFDAAGRHTKMGFGRLDVEAAVKKALQMKQGEAPCAD